MSSLAPAVPSSGIFPPEDTSNMRLPWLYSMQNYDTVSVPLPRTTSLPGAYPSPDDDEIGDKVSRSWSATQDTSQTRRRTYTPSPLSLPPQDTHSNNAAFPNPVPDSGSSDAIVSTPCGSLPVPDVADLLDRGGKPGGMAAMPCFRMILKYPDNTRLAKKGSREDLTGKSTGSSVYMSNRLLVEATVEHEILNITMIPIMRLDSSRYVISGVSLFVEFGLPVSSIDPPCPTTSVVSPNNEAFKSSHSGHLLQHLKAWALGEGGSRDRNGYVTSGFDLGPSHPESDTHTWKNKLDAEAHPEMRYNVQIALPSTKDPQTQEPRDASNTPKIPPFFVVLKVQLVDKKASTSLHPLPPIEYTMRAQYNDLQTLIERGEGPQSIALHSEGTCPTVWMEQWQGDPIEDLRFVSKRQYEERPKTEAQYNEDLLFDVSAQFKVMYAPKMGVSRYATAIVRPFKTFKFKCAKYQRDRRRCLTGKNERRSVEANTSAIKSWRYSVLTTVVGKDGEVG